MTCEEDQITFSLSLFVIKTQKVDLGFFLKIYPVKTSKNEHRSGDSDDSGLSLLLVCGTV